MIGVVEGDRALGFRLLGVGGFVASGYRRVRVEGDGVENGQL